MYAGFWEGLFEEEAEAEVFFFVDGDDEDGVVGVEELACDVESALHEGQPFGVAIVVVFCDVVVVVFPVFGAGVVGRVDVDGIDGVAVGVGE